jgi:osmoprotectant transport system ATP-binding protein
MIRLEGLTKRYGTTLAVDEVTTEFPPRAITAVVGSSGSGKSTLLRLINRLIEPSAGRVLIDGRDVSLDAPHLLRRRIGYAIQGVGLFPHRTVAQNIATVPALLGWERARIDARVEELLRLFHLDPARFAMAYPSELSGGQQQRVGVARALAADPVLLLMDEPFGALDPLLRASAQQDLREIQRRLGTTVVLVTHDIDEAFRLADHIAVMHHGRLLQNDAPERLVAAPADPRVAELIGSGERSLRLLARLGAGDCAEPGQAPGNPVPAGTNLREVLAELLWRGADALPVEHAEGPMRITLAAILLRGREAP